VWQQLIDRRVLTLLSTDPALITFPNDAQALLSEAGRAASRQLGYEGR